MVQKWHMYFACRRPLFQRLTSPGMVGKDPGESLLIRTDNTEQDRPKVSVDGRLSILDNNDSYIIGIKDTENWGAYCTVFRIYVGHSSGRTVLFWI